MNSNLLDSPLASRGWASSQALYWVSLLLVMLALSGLAIIIEADSLNAATPFEQLLSYRLTSCSNLLLAIAAVLYLGHLRMTSMAVGRWATGLATVGVIGAVAGLLTRCFELHQSMVTGNGSFFNAHEGTALLTAITVLVYLVMERNYRSRAAGALVMPIVLFAIAFEIWLVANGQASGTLQGSALNSYWLNAQLLANVFGFGLFTMAAAVGFLYLLRRSSELEIEQNSAFIQMLPNTMQTDAWITNLIHVGFPVFTLGVLSDMDSLSRQWGEGFSWYPREAWALIACFAFGTFFYFKWVKRWPTEYLAWWAVSAYGITLLCFLGVNLFVPIPLLG